MSYHSQWNRMTEHISNFRDILLVWVLIIDGCICGEVLQNNGAIGNFVRSQAVTNVGESIPTVQNRKRHDIRRNGTIAKNASLNMNSRDITEVYAQDGLTDDRCVPQDVHDQPKKILPVWKPLELKDIKTDKDKVYYEKYNFLPPRSSNCDNFKGPGLDYTIVTALVDLKREDWPHFRRMFLKYCYYAVQLLNLHAPMVIYVDEKVVDFVQYHRQGKEHLTKIIPISIRDLEYYKYYDVIKATMASDQFKENHSMLHHPEGFSPDYNILMNSKLSMLFKASTKNFFSTHYYYWMDIGYGHGEDIFPKSCLWSPHAIMNNVDQITYIELNPLSVLKSIDDLYKKSLPAFLNGAFFGGPSISIKRYYFLHREVFLDFLSRGRVDDDQTLAVACYFQNPILFNIVKGWWYDVFTIFKT